MEIGANQILSDDFAHDRKKRRDENRGNSQKCRILSDGNRSKIPTKGKIVRQNLVHPYFQIYLAGKPGVLSYAQRISCCVNHSFILQSEQNFMPTVLTLKIGGREIWRQKLTQFLCIIYIIESSQFLCRVFLDLLIK